MKIHHLGYAVRDIPTAIQSFEMLGYTAGPVTKDSSRQIEICFMKNGDYCVELVTPDGPENDVEGILKKNGAAPYHICYEVPDMTEAISDLTKKGGGFLLIKPPKCAPAIDGRTVAFLWNRKIGLIELVEQSRK